jgi:hypothetical protein
VLLAKHQAYVIADARSTEGAGEMAFVELDLHLRFDSGRSMPEARAWVDLEPDGALTRETELALRRTGANDWRGTFAMADAGPRCFLYRVGLVAHAGAEWWLTLRERDHVRPLLSDHDTLAMAKGWLVGTCELTRAPHRVDASYEPRRNALVVPLRRTR